MDGNTQELDDDGGRSGYLPQSDPDRRARARRLARTFLEAGVSYRGLVLAEALETVHRGHRGPLEVPLYDALALEVRELRELRELRVRRPTISLRDIGAALGKGPQTIANLEAHGRALEQR